MQVQDLIKAAEKGNLKFEINKLSEDYITLEGNVIAGQNEIGILYMTDTRGCVWAWWTYYRDEEGQGYPLFRNTYDQYTGKETKSWKRGAAVERQLERILNNYNEQRRN